MQKRLVAVATAWLVLYSIPVKAQTPASGTLGMKGPLLDAVKAVPIPGFAKKLAELQALSVPDQPTSSFYTRRSGNLQLHVDKGSGQVAFVVIEGSVRLSDLALTGLFKRGTLDKLAGSQLTDPIFAISALEGDLETKGLPPMFKTIIDRSYYKVPSINIKPGLQIYSKVRIGGHLGDVLEKGMGLPVKDFTMRAGVTGDAPSVPRSKADAQSKLKADEMFRAMVKKGIDDKEKRDKKAEDDRKRAAGETVEEEQKKKELYVELQMAPGASFSGPMKMSAITLTDVTLFLNNEGKVGYKGNATIKGVADGNKILAFYEGPILPNGLIKLADANMGFAASQLTAADVAKIGLAIGPAGLVTGIDALAPAVNAMDKPLSAFVLRNPKPVPAYKVGDDWPDIDKFQVVAIGPLGAIGEQKGPLLKAKGDAKVLGQQMAAMDLDMSASGLNGKTSAGVSLGLGPLGTQSLTLAATVGITREKQVVGLSGNFLGRRLNMDLNGSTISVSSPATCATPVSLSGSVALASTVTLAEVSKAITGVNVNPVQIAECTGEALKAAYKWIGTNGAKLGGYTAAAADAALKGFGKGAQVIADNLDGKSTPNRGVLDCSDTGVGSQFQKVGGGSRLWGDRHEYERSKGTNWRRFVYSEATKKFRPVTTGAVFQITWCGGIVGEDGVTRAKHTVNDLMSHAVMCQDPVKGLAVPAIPPAMIGPPISTTEECYAARGLAKPRPEWADKSVELNNYIFLVNRQGYKQHIKDEGVLRGCGAMTRQQTGPDDFFSVPLGPELTTAQQCLQARGMSLTPRKDLAGRAVKLGSAIYLIDSNGATRHIRGDVYGGCGSPQASAISDADLGRIPTGPQLTTVQGCLLVRGMSNQRMDLAGYSVQVSGDSRIYLVNRNGMKQHIANEPAWRGCGHKGLRQLSAAELNGIPDGGPALTTAAACQAAR